MANVRPGNEGIIQFMTTASRALGYTVNRVLVIVLHKGGAPLLQLVARDGRQDLKVEKQQHTNELEMARVGRVLIGGDTKIPVAQLESTGGSGRRWVLCNLTTGRPERVGGLEVEARFNQV